MKWILPDRAAVTAMMVILALLMLMHVLILLGVLPYNIVWGGQITDPAMLPVYEVVALVVLAFFLLLVLLRAGVLGGQKAQRLSRWLMWLPCVYFLLNTAGNLASSQRLETLVFTPVSLVLALLALRLALKRS